MNELLTGRDIVRPDAKDKVRGAAKYAADYNMDGQLYAVLVRSARAHARILSVDTSAAEAEAFVYTAADLAENVIVDIVPDRPVLASAKVRYFGEPIAVAAADTFAAAKRAAALVKVEYEDIPACLTADEALADGAPIVNGEGNLISSFEHMKGDIDAGFAKADLIIEREYSTPCQEHAYMEPDAGFSYMDGDVLTVISSSQSVFNDRRMVMKALGLTEEQVRVKAATVGGAFGGKDGHMTQIFGALVTQKTGRPAKIVFDRRESMAFTFKRHSTKLRVRVGFKKDGTIVAFDGESLVDTGAYIGYGLTVLGLLSEHMAGPYRIPDVRIRGRLVYTNKVPASAFRGFGAPQAAFATESVISEAADKLCLDQVAIRVKNALVTGDTGSLGQPIAHSCGIKQALLQLEQTELWQSRSTNTDPDIGYGLAAGHLSCGFGKNIPDGAEVELFREDGKYVINVGFVEIGQGAIGSLTALAADALGVGAGQVRVVMGDTKGSFDCGSTAASRSTFIAGNAILSAAREYLEREAKGEKDIRAREREQFPEAPEMIKNYGMPHAMYTYVAQAVKVRVNRLTGQVRVLDAAAVTEAGTIINPMQLAGQVQGGMVQSLGFALTENNSFTADGRLEQDSFETCLIPTMYDAPHIYSETVDMYEQSGPGGAKGAAEAPTVPTAGAVNAAIADVTGVWCTDLPITPERVLSGIMEAKG